MSFDSPVNIDPWKVGVFGLVIVCVVIVIIFMGLWMDSQDDLQKCRLHKSLSCKQQPPNVHSFHAHPGEPPVLKCPAGRRINVQNAYLKQNMAIEDITSQVAKECGTSSNSGHCQLSGWSNGQVYGSYTCE